MFTKATQLFLNSGSASQAVLAAQLLANQIASQQAAEQSKVNYHGRMRKGHQPPAGTFAAPGVAKITRQQLRADVSADAKEFDARMYKRRRERAALDLSKRVEARETMGIERRDTRMGVRAIIERGRFGTLSRRNFS